MPAFTQRPGTSDCLKWIHFYNGNKWLLCKLQTSLRKIYKFRLSASRWSSPCSSPIVSSSLKAALKSSQGKRPTRPLDRSEAARSRAEAGHENWICWTPGSWGGKKSQVNEILTAALLRNSWTKQLRVAINFQVIESEWLVSPFRMFVFEL